MYDPLSQTGVEIAKIKTTSQPPAAALAASGIADLWDIVWCLQAGRTGVRLAVGGDVVHSSDWLIAADPEYRWVRTAEKLWRLGWPNDARPPIVQVALRPDRRQAFEHALDRTGKHTLPPRAVAAATRNPGAEGTAAAIAAILREQNRPAVADAWHLLSIDATDQGQLASGVFALGMSVSAMLERDRHGEVMASLDSWTRLLKAPPGNPDPFAAAQVGKVPSVLNELFVRIVNDEENGNGTVH